MAEPAARRHPDAVSERDRWRGQHAGRARAVQRTGRLRQPVGQSGAHHRSVARSTGRRTMRAHPGRDRFRTERRGQYLAGVLPRPGPAPIRGGRSDPARPAGRRSRRHQLRVLRLRTRLAVGRTGRRVRGGDRRRGPLARVARAGRHRGRVLWCWWCFCCRRCATARPRFRWRWWRRRRSSTRSSTSRTASTCGPAPPCWAPCRLCCWPRDCLGRRYDWRI